MFAVNPKTDCPHVEELDIEKITGRLYREIVHNPCEKCQDCTENWLCLQCESIFCSRYVSGHMAQHNEECGHMVALSFSDSSVWCYRCDSYVTSPAVTAMSRRLGDVKFTPGTEEVQGKSDALSSPLQTKVPFGSASKMTKEVAEFTFEDLVSGIQEKKFTKIAVLTGAGISVAAGIPDFRTPGTGLYSKVAELGLPYPEAIFSLDFLKANPEPFFKIANGFLSFKAHPVMSHYFVKKIADEGMLLMNFTQNIDGLELEAGLPEELLVQAHGHMRSARCCECQISAPITDFFAHVAMEKVMYCSTCNVPEAEGPDAARIGIVKPDIIFFGESLPMRFLASMRQMLEADLVFVMGTSLKVFPFAGLLDLIAPAVPVVLVNRENPGRIDTSRHPMLFLQGAIEESVAKLADALGWELGGTTAGICGEKADA